MLRRCYGLIYRLLSSSEPVSEELMPIVCLLSPFQDISYDFFFKIRLTNCLPSKNASTRCWNMVVLSTPKISIRCVHLSSSLFFQMPIDSIVSTGFTSNRFFTQRRKIRQCRWYNTRRTRHSYGSSQWMSRTCRDGEFSLCCLFFFFFKQKNSKSSCLHCILS